MAFRIIKKVSSGEETREKILDVPGRVLRIGRGALNELQLDSLTLPLNQAEMTRDEEGVFALRDVAQGHIIYLNGVPVKEAILRPGDVITIENYRLSIAQDDLSSPLVVVLEEASAGASEPSLALMSRLRLSNGRWTKWRIAVLLVVTLSAVWAALGAWSHSAVLMPNGVSLKHTYYEKKCEVCHTSAKPVWNYVDNAACQNCHNTGALSPAHFKVRKERQEGQEGVALSDVPACASCHLEHKGVHVLADVDDRNCVQCHGSLQAKDPKVPNLAVVHSFSGDHPEFAVTQSRPDGQGVVRVRLNDGEQLKDGGRLKLNHSLHLKLGDKILEPFKRTAMTCSDCHHADDDGRFMKPISFQRDCAACHSNELDLAPLVPGRQVRHGQQLDKVRQELDEIFSLEYRQAHPGEANKPDSLRWIPGRRLPGQPVTPHERYVVDRRVEAEMQLLSPKGKRCLKCHDLDGGAEDLASAVGENGTFARTVGEAVIQEGGPSSDGGSAEAGAMSMSAGMGKMKKQIARVNVPVRWLPYNRFDHRAHASISELREKNNGNWCLSCHEHAADSMKTEDVLLPSISQCRTCHIESGGAQAKCRSCHEFHVPKLDPFSTQPVTKVSAHVGE